MSRRWWVEEDFHIVGELTAGHGSPLAGAAIWLIGNFSIFFGRYRVAVGLVEGVKDQAR